MRNSAMVAFVVVISKCFPIVIAVHLPCVVECVLAEVESLEALLRVDTLEIIFPRDGIWRRVQIDPDEAQRISVNMHGEQTLVLFLESRDVIELRGFGQFSVEAVRPPMVLARKDFRIALVFRDKGESSMATNIMEPVQVALPIKTQHKGESRLLEPKEVAGLREAQLVGDQDPFLREDSASFQLVHLWSTVPGCRKSLRWLIW